MVCAVDVHFSALEIARGNVGFTEENIHFLNQDVREFNLQTLNVPGLCCGYESTIQNKMVGHNEWSDAIVRKQKTLGKR